MRTLWQGAMPLCERCGSRRTTILSMTSRLGRQPEQRAYECECCKRIGFYAVANPNAGSDQECGPHPYP
jgi:hypothetical protein